MNIKGKKHISKQILQRRHEQYYETKIKSVTISFLFQEDEQRKIKLWYEAEQFKETQ